jgi:hypothetical protein
VTKRPEPESSDSSEPAETTVDHPADPDATSEDNETMAPPPESSDDAGAAVGDAPSANTADAPAEATDVETSDLDPTEGHDIHPVDEDHDADAAAEDTGPAETIGAPAPEIPASATPGPDAPSASAAPATAAVAPRAGRARPQARSKRRIGIIVGGVAAALVIAVGGVFIGMNRDDSASSTESQAKIASASGLTGKCAGYDPKKATGGFSGPDSTTSLGRTTTTKKTWKTDAAEFGISGSQAYVVSRLSGAPAQAVVTQSSANGVVCATISSVHLGTGVVFRQQDPANYWMFTAVPGYATWNVTLVQDGVPKLIGNTGLTTFDDGTVISAQMFGNKLNLYVNGKLRKSITSSKFAKARSVGIISAGDADAANLGRWRNFVADTYSHAPSKSKQSAAASATTK